MLRLIGLSNSQIMSAGRWKTLTVMKDCVDWEVDLALRVRAVLLQAVLKEEEAHTHGGSVLGIQPGAGRVNVVTNNICLSVPDGTAAVRMTYVCYFKQTEISACLVGRRTDAWPEDQAWSGDR